MTIEKFLPLLELTGTRTWELAGHWKTAIRLNLGSTMVCPLQWAVFHLYPEMNLSREFPWICGNALSMSPADRQAIFRASDNIFDPTISPIHASDHALRKRILAVCRLEDRNVL